MTTRVLNSQPIKNTIQGTCTKSLTIYNVWKLYIQPFTAAAVNNVRTLNSLPARGAIDAGYASSITTLHTRLNTLPAAGAINAGYASVQIIANTRITLNSLPAQGVMGGGYASIQKVLSVPNSAVRLDAIFKQLLVRLNATIDEDYN